MNDSNDKRVLFGENTDWGILGSWGILGLQFVLRGFREKEVYVDRHRDTHTEGWRECATILTENLGEGDIVLCNCS